MLFCLCILYVHRYSQVASTIIHVFFHIYYFQLCWHCANFVENFLKLICIIHPNQHIVMSQSSLPKLELECG